MSDLEILKQNKPDIAEFLERWRSKYERTFDLKDSHKQADFYEGMVEMAKHMAVAAKLGTLRLQVSNAGAIGLTVAVTPA